MAELIHGELSYRIIGVLYQIYNTIGSGLQEKYYQRAIAKVFQKEGIQFTEQLMVPLEMDKVKIVRYFIDFVVEGKIVLEIKAKNHFSLKDIKQVLGYLKQSGIEVGLLVAFSSESLRIKRILKGYRK